MADEIITELWEIKDNIAQRHGYDVEALVARLRARKVPEGGRIEELRASTRTTQQNGPANGPKLRP